MEFSYKIQEFSLAKLAKVISPDAIKNFKKSGELEIEWQAPTQKDNHFEAERSFNIKLHSQTIFGPRKECIA